MNTKSLRCVGYFVVAGVLMLVGCRSGMYSSDVSVDRCKGGVCDYTVVETLPVGDLPAAMPVVVKSSLASDSQTLEKRDELLMLWGFTLGVIPVLESASMTYEVSVVTPLGEKSGTFTVEARSWFGWLPIFLPYPGIADERIADPKLPNATLMTQAKDRLVANLVSQFTKEQYERLLVKHNSPEEKAKRAKEAAERVRLEKERAERVRLERERVAQERVRLAQERAEAERKRVAQERVERVRLEKERAEKARLAWHGNLVADTVKRDLAQIKKCYGDGQRYRNPFQDRKDDWLARWSLPRLELTQSDALAGEAILSEFGTKYLPNGYANYEKRREELAEIQQMFNEEFPQPWTIREASPAWNAFNKLLERFVKARSEAFLCHDELCHYWLLWRFGVLADRDFAAVDKRGLSVVMYPEDIKRAEFEDVPLRPVEGAVLDFAGKYAPLSSGNYQEMARALKEVGALLSEVSLQRRQMDDVRGGRAFVAAVAKRNALVRELNALSFQLQAWRVDHRTMLKSSDDVARCDADMSTKLKPFLDSLPGYVKERTLGPVIADAELVAIPGKWYRMQRTEVTQFQWMLVMGSNPSAFPGLDRPVENVSWNDCQEFIRRASAMDGRCYRLPTKAQWEHACRAGTTSKYNNGGDRVADLKRLGRYEGNQSDGRGGYTYGHTAVGSYAPNAWGLYDMHGNVEEWCLDWNGSYRVKCGGSWYSSAVYCTSSSLTTTYPSYASDYIGFRLVRTLNNKTE